MYTDFRDAMSKRTDEDLIKIVTVSRSDYQPLAVEAAEQEIKNRGIDATTIEQTQLDLAAQIEEEKQSDAEKVGITARFINFIADSTVCLLIVAISTYPLNADDSTDVILGYIILFLSFTGYYVLMEARYQKTVGKFITRTKVVCADGSKPASGDIVRRTFCRLIPFDKNSFLFFKDGFHDRFSNTRVIKD